MDNYKIIGEIKSVLGESPIWDENYQRLYWVDIESKKLNAWDYISNKTYIWKFNNRICAIALTEDKDILLCAFDRFFAFFNINSKNLNKIESNTSIPKSVRFNDGKTDNFGRFWCGTMSESKPKNPEASIYMLDANLEVRKIYDNIVISNSLSASNDNKSIYFSDTYTKKIYKGKLTNDKNNFKKVSIFRDNYKFSGFPDGSTIDIDGNLWNAEWDGSRLVKYDSNSNVIDIINLPVKRPTSCTFGGPDMNFLFVTSAMVNDDKKNDINGKVLYFKPNAKGNFYSRFKKSI